MILSSLFRRKRRPHRNRTIEDLTPGWNNTGYRLAVLFRAQHLADARAFESTAELLVSTLGFDGITSEIARLRSPENDAHAALTLSRLYPEMADGDAAPEEIEVVGEGRSLEVAVDRIEARLARMDGKIAAMAPRSAAAEVRR